MIFKNDIMKFLNKIGGKISDKISDTIEERLNPKVQSSHPKTKIEFKEEQSAKNCKKYHEREESQFTTSFEVCQRAWVVLKNNLSK